MASYQAGEGEARIGQPVVKAHHGILSLAVEKGYQRHLAFRQRSIWCWICTFSNTFRPHEVNRVVPESADRAIEFDAQLSNAQLSTAQLGHPL